MWGVGGKQAAIPVCLSQIYKKSATPRFLHPKRFLFLFSHSYYSFHSFTNKHTMSPRFPYHISVAAMARSFENMVHHDMKPPLPPPPKLTAVVPSVSSSSTTSSVSTASSSTLSSPISLRHNDSNDFFALLFTVWMHMHLQLAVLVLVRASFSPPLARVSQLCLLDDIPCLDELVVRHTRPSVASLWHEHEQAGYAKRVQKGPSRRRVRKNQPLLQGNGDQPVYVEDATMAKLAQDVLLYLQCSSYETSSELQALTPRLQGYAAAV